MNRQFASDEIGFGGENVTIFADAYDLAGVLKLAERSPNQSAIAAFCAELLCNLVSVQRPIIGSAQQGESLFSNCATVFAHLDETILEDAI